MTIIMSLYLFNAPGWTRVFKFTSMTSSHQRWSWRTKCVHVATAGRFSWVKRRGLLWKEETWAIAPAAECAASPRQTDRPVEKQGPFLPAYWIHQTKLIACERGAGHVPAQDVCGRSNPNRICNVKGIWSDRVVCLRGSLVRVFTIIKKHEFVIIMKSIVHIARPNVPFRSLIVLVLRLAIHVAYNSLARHFGKRCFRH